MKPRETIGESSEKPEFRLAARAVSRGTAVGTVVCLYGRTRQFFRRVVDPSGLRIELERFDSAVKTARKQLKQLSSKPPDAIGRSAPGIFDAHLLILDEGSFCEKIRAAIESNRVSSEWATKTIVDSYVARYKALHDETLRERYIDVEDVGERILAALGGSVAPFAGFAKHSVIVSDELRPSTLVELADSEPAAIITQNGGWTSHTFIISRELNLPAVTGISRLLRRVHDGDQVIVDGYTGEVVVNPTEKTLRRFEALPAARDELPVYESSGPLKTLDGRQILVHANADSPSVYARAKGYGALGIGLYRSEYLFSRAKTFPSEADQILAYSAIADAAGEDGVKIRTFDLNQDSIGTDGLAHEKNPALGLRAVRLSLAHRTHIGTQLRALLIASRGRRIDIVIPMVSGVAEILEISEILEKERRRLRTKKIEFGEPRLGVMIEVPSAVITIDQILDHIDFISLGTNDLVQYLLAVDRDNESVAEWFASLHPGVLRAIKSVIDAATAANKDLVICGEMAGSPYYIPILVGLGARQLSMNANSIASVSRLIAGIAFEEARTIALDCLRCATPADAESVLLRGIREKWGPLFPPHFELPVG
jgi:phosphotransferase system enzyme I (PtsI)